MKALRGLGESVLQQKTCELGAAQHRRDLARERYENAHRDVVRLEAEIEALEYDLRRL